MWIDEGTVIKTLRNYRLIDIYSNKEGLVTRVEGSVYGDDRFPDGNMIITSQVIARQGNLIRTESGTVYRLENE